MEQLQSPNYLAHLQEQYNVGMPALTRGGLSEVWLFKHFGDLHWKLTSQCIQKPLSTLLDPDGFRIYNTFVRVIVSGSVLSSFHEDTNLSIGGGIYAHGASTLISDLNLSHPDGANLKVNMMSMFSRRQSSGSNGLSKAQLLPTNTSEVGITQHRPAILRDYQMLKKHISSQVLIDNHLVEVDFNQVLGEYHYTINPFTDVNGVGLLYFPSYISIADFCFSRLELVNDPLDYHTSYRDIHYYANSDLNDKILFRLHYLNILPEKELYYVASLSSLNYPKQMAVLACKKSYNRFKAI